MYELLESDNTQNSVILTSFTVRIVENKATDLFPCQALSTLCRFKTFHLTKNQKRTKIGATLG